MKELLKRIRIFILLTFKYKFKTVGKNFYCGRNLIVRSNTVFLGDYVYIGNNAHLSIDKIIIDDYTLLASNVSIIGGDHKFSIVGTPIRETGRDIRKSVYIGKDCWIGHGAIIFDGVTIGEGCIIGAGSIVIKSVPEYSIAVGNPARVIRKRFSENDIEKHKLFLKL